MVILHLENWIILCKKDPAIFRLCSGMRMFRELPNIVDLTGKIPVQEVLRDDTTSLVYISYIKCLRSFLGNYSASRERVITFTSYLINTLRTQYRRPVNKGCDSFCCQFYIFNCWFIHFIY